MKIRTFFYVIGQGIKNAFKNKSFTLASVATISACLFLFGVCYAIVLNCQHIIKTAEEGVSISVFFEDGLSDERIQQIGELIGSHSAVSKLQFVSADEAWEGFKDTYLGEYADGFTENPLENSENYQIYMNDISRQKELVSYLESLEGVRRVNYSDVVASLFSGTDQIVAYVSVGLIVLLLAVSIFLISNTVTIGIAVRKEEIAIMKYIGATDFFVRSPFVIEGIFIGAIGSAIPIGVVYWLYGYVLNWMPKSVDAGAMGFYPVLLSVDEVLRYLVPTSLLLGIGIGFFGSAITVRKHLHV